MKYKNIELDTYLNVVTNCIDANGVVGFAIAHNYRTIREALQEYSNKKEKLIRQYGEEQPDGSFVILDPKKLEAGNKELAKYAELEVECDIMKVAESVFFDSGLTARQILSLDWMTELPKPEAAKIVDPSNPIGDDDRFGL